MTRYIDYNKIGKANYGWLDTHHHFSFASYQNPSNMQFGVLRVLNDDTVKPSRGFDAHPHNDMEIISYVIDGKLTHADSMGNQQTLGRGQVQYMSAGTGVVHSEHNVGPEMLRFLQIWILANKEGYAPNYGQHNFKWEDRIDQWLPLATSYGSNTAPIKVHADINIFATLVTQGKQLTFDVKQNRQAYLVLIEGQATICGHKMKQGDALEVIEEEIIIAANAGTDAHIMVLEMARSE